MSRAMRRVNQFWRALGASIDPRELNSLSEYLEPKQRLLFARMALSDQRHCLDLFYGLRARRGEDAPLLRAALLHDVGKSAAPIHLWQRAAYVLVGRISERARATFCAGDGRGWRKAFYVLAHHTDLGADMAQQAGCSSEVVALIRNHQRPVNPVMPPPAMSRLRALQSADDD